MQKLYCYVDESGQDIRSNVFIVSVIIAQKDRNEVVKFLKQVEKDSQKLKTKWKTKTPQKIDYISKILTSELFKDKIFYSLTENSSAYQELTVIAIASSINSVQPKKGYKASVFIDGLPASQVKKVSTQLRKSVSAQKKSEESEMRAIPLLDWQTP